MKTRLLIAVTTVLIAACPGDVSVPIDEAWLSCETDDECVGVSNEQICFAGGCSRAAINDDFLTAYRTAFAEKRESCLYIQTGDTSCDDELTACIEGQCVLLE